MPVELLSLNHISLRTRDVQKSVRFYVDTLGFREISRPPFDFPGAWLFGAGIQIHLIEQPFEETSREINTRENHVAFACPDLDAVEETLRAQAMPYKRNVVPGRKTNQIFVRDPDGWLIEIAHYSGPIDR